MAGKGGARPNTGPKRGSKNKPRQITAEQAKTTAEHLVNLERTTKRTPDQRRCKDLLAEGAKFMFGCMSQVAPIKTLNEKGEPELNWRRPTDKEAFFAFADRMGLFAARAAPFEDPTYRAIAIVSQGSGDKTPLLDANVVALDDAMGASRIYARMMKETKAA